MDKEYHIYISCTQFTPTCIVGVYSPHPDLVNAIYQTWLGTSALLGAFYLLGLYMPTYPSWMKPCLLLASSGFILTEDPEAPRIDIISSACTPGSHRFWGYSCT